MKLSSMRANSFEREVLRVPAEKVAIVDGMLRLIVCVESLHSNLAEISEENPKEGRSLAGQG